MLSDLPARRVEAHREDHIVMAVEHVLHQAGAGVDHMAGAVVAACQAPLTAAIKAHVGQRQNVRVVAFVQIELFFYRFP